MCATVCAKHTHIYYKLVQIFCNNAKYCLIQYWNKLWDNRWPEWNRNLIILYNNYTHYYVVTQILHCFFVQ